MRSPLSFILLVLIVLTSRAQASAYDDLILSHKPRLYLTLGSLTRTTFEPDLSGNGHRALRFPQNWTPDARLPNGDRATVFDGRSQYLEVASHAHLSVPTTGSLTLETWIRPDTLQFPASQDGYVHFAGKGEPGAQEYVFRMYNRASDRPSRISAYAFNPDGGLGSGSYFQDSVTVGEWIHVAAVINTQSSAAYPDGYVKIYKNGQLRDTDSLRDYSIEPVAGNAPLRIGTRDLNSFFQGAIAKFAVYGYELSAAALAQHVKAMRSKPRPPIGRVDGLDEVFQPQ
ncbi:MAG TPA: LamG domain-containing protein [Oligoflexus sp.]|uniref:LamG domain-containing protein n=1 Tax=Oligoflexus sp. TaxID=1971216 RepID=UPI002D7EAB3D|nr:LamG domain-containing protein [Oligoflexus sp.]HET9236687.1 LamG domain-containing protein [Oligoflexus sp.]